MGLHAGIELLQKKVIQLEEDNLQLRLDVSQTFNKQVQARYPGRVLSVSLNDIKKKNYVVCQ